MAKEVKNRITLDASRFERGATAVTRASRRMQRSLGDGMRRAARAGAAGLAAAGAAGIGMGVGIAAGVKKVINLGADLDHLKTQTGVAVSELMLLRQAMEDNGVSAESARKALNRMQKQIVDAGDGLSTPVRAFERLGLSVDALREMQPGEQFRTIAAAIAATEDPAVRAATAMDIFGRAGAEMQGVFQTDFTEVAASLGQQAGLLEKNSVLFERVGTLLDRTGNKLQGFFVGVADKVVPVILPLLERLDKLDIAEQGQQFGQGVASGLKAVIGLFETNTIGDLTRESLLLAGTQFLNSFARGWAMIFSGTADTLWAFAKELVGFWKTSLTQLATGFIDIITSGFKNFIEFASSGFLAIGNRFSALILDGLGKAMSKIWGLGEQGQQLQEEAGRLRGIAGEHKTDAENAANAQASVFKEAFAPLVETLKNAPSNFQSKLGDAFLDGALMLEDWDLFSTDGMQGRITQLIRNAIAATDVAPVESTGSKNVGPFDDPEENPLGSLFGNSRTAQALTGGVSSLAAIGGGGGVGAASGIETAVQAGNEILRGISNEIRGLRNDQRGMRNQQFGLSAPVLA